MLDPACVKGEWLQGKTIPLPCNQRPNNIIQRYQKGGYKKQNPSFPYQTDTGSHRLSPSRPSVIEYTV
ncbi:hypothetical protein TRIATDRAFT_258994 [Trichoderma atroviride IMI 206040]|uniref:Uncharacterized protein n=1 Tax=Hypocrea atroviridis (strain ATCC 20476 / IMI 206040) TaxID=452589 RepID=G9P8E4_HYPAI|nr:uncharacterized protein TRIATDRAFT_258994 [Trichoderma atroviride IMI 206040]EHK40938.1 hypothetical protein TRIATDRAFT_258994 [Trichoderma atroviride IMI 206040]